MFLVETLRSGPISRGYAELAMRSPVRVAVGEWLATRYKFVELMDRGSKHVQPDGGGSAG